MKKAIIQFSAKFTIETISFILSEDPPFTDSAAVLLLLIQGGIECGGPSLVATFECEVPLQTAAFVLLSSCMLHATSRMTRQLAAGALLFGLSSWVFFLPLLSEAVEGEAFGISIGVQTDALGEEKKENQPAFHSEAEPIPVGVIGKGIVEREKGSGILPGNSAKTAKSPVSRKKLAAAGLVAAVTAGVGLHLLLTFWRKTSLKEAKQRLPQATLELEASRNHAEDIKTGLPDAFEDLLDAYEEHVHVLTRRYAEAIDRLQLCELIPCIPVGKAKGAYLKIKYSIKPSFLQDEWLNVQKSIELQVSAESVKTVEAAVAAFARKLESLLDHPNKAYGAQLIQLRDDVVEILQQHEKDANSVKLHSGDRVEESHITRAQEFVHLVSLVVNREGTLKAIRERRGFLLSSLQEYAETVSRIVSLEQEIQEIQAYLSEMSQE
ncbi:hypothetical protein Efla_004909 [Eimeria flavescens]